MRADVEMINSFMDEPVLLDKCGCSKRLTANRCQSLVFPNRTENMKKLVQ